MSTRKACTVHATGNVWRHSVNRRQFLVSSWFESAGLYCNLNGTSTRRETWRPAFQARHLSKKVHEGEGDSGGERDIITSSIPRVKPFRWVH